ncbi:RHS repeat-associated core domain-containing protein [Streptomyces sp. NRRL F-2664]|uniref:RHS repeat-associated core domain-containing protein n=1 Tax=Streptomyces sp. NRRL F-2664 TaxID=1463842 RepID=UPI000D1421A0
MPRPRCCGRPPTPPTPQATSPRSPSPVRTGWRPPRCMRPMPRAASPPSPPTARPPARPGTQSATSSTAQTAQPGPTTPTTNPPPPPPPTACAASTRTGPTAAADPPPPPPPTAPPAPPPSTTPPTAPSPTTPTPMLAAASRAPAATSPEQQAARHAPSPAPPAQPGTCTPTAAATPSWKPDRQPKPGTDYTPARLYHPETGRFTTRDPHPTPLNKYQAFNAEPVNGIDPSGNITIRILGKYKKNPAGKTVFKQPRLTPNAVSRMDEDSGRYSGGLQETRASGPVPGHTLAPLELIEIAPDPREQHLVSLAENSGFTHLKIKWDKYGDSPKFDLLSARNSDDARFASSVNLSMKDYYHGTSRSSALSIKKEGFSLQGRAHGRTEGDGVYASPNYCEAMRYGRSLVCFNFSPDILIFKSSTIHSPEYFSRKRPDLNAQGEPPAGTMKGIASGRYQSNGISFGGRYLTRHTGGDTKAPILVLTDPRSVTNIVTNEG